MTHDWPCGLSIFLAAGFVRAHFFDGEMLLYNQPPSLCCVLDAYKLRSVPFSIIKCICVRWYLWSMFVWIIDVFIRGLIQIHQLQKRRAYVHTYVLTVSTLLGLSVGWMDGLSVGRTISLSKFLKMKSYTSMLLSEHLLIAFQ